MSNKSKLLAIALISALLLTTAMSLVKAQGNATVVVLDAVGGTVDPSGTKTYSNGTPVTFTATPLGLNFIFSYWLISSDTGNDISSDNPFTLTVAGGLTYAVQAVFTLVQPPPGQPVPVNLASVAIVVVLPSAGGTTVPAPGTYALENATALDLKATPNSGWQFVHWTISGDITGHGTSPLTLTPTDNPYNVNHGYGDTYRYQAVFVPTGGSEPTPAGSTPTPTPGGTLGGMSTDTWIIIGLVVVIIVILIAFGVYAMKKK